MGGLVAVVALGSVGVALGVTASSRVRATTQEQNRIADRVRTLEADNSEPGTRQGVGLEGL